MTMLRGSFPVQIETRCEKGHVYRYGPLDPGECPICIDPPKTRGPMSDEHRVKLREGKTLPLTAGEIELIHQMHDQGKPLAEIKKKVRRGTDRIREALKGAE